MAVHNKLKKQFKKTFDQYLKATGQPITVSLTPYSVDCPNCLPDLVRGTSANVYDTSFIRPVNIFPGTPSEEVIYPAPFNVLSVSGVQYDPSILDPKILKTTVCPVCIGKGKLTSPNNVCINALVTWNPKEEMLDISPGREGQPICRIKTDQCNYSVVRDAESFLVNGEVCHLHIPPRPKGLGDDHLIEAYLIASEVGHSVTENYDQDNRLATNPIGRVSDQAPPSTPTIPPTVPGEDVW